MVRVLAPCALALLLLPARTAAATDSAWAGTWVTDEGAMELEQDGSSVEGTYSLKCRIDGKVSGRKLEGTYEKDGESGKVELELAADGTSFRGTFTHPSGEEGTWRGWKRDEEAESKAAADFGGVWLTSIGTLDLTQKASGRVEGPWGNAGWGKLAGTAKGRRLEARIERPSWSGPVWLEQTADGKRIFGLTNETPPSAVRGVRVEGFSRAPKLEAGRIAQGIAKNGLLYFARPPDGWKPGTPVDAIVLLHGSNWTTRGMVAVTARNWPAIAKRYMVVGIQGDQWVPYSDVDNLRFNYHYVNWTGKSTYKGFPHTERDSPQIVAETVEELAAAHKWGRVFVGGHSQGGFLTYLLAMHFPERFAGAFPIAGGMIIQAEPDVFEDEALKAAQRALPIAIVHGSKDDVVPFATALYVRDRYEGSGFPLTTLIAPPLGHPYDFLPIGEAIAWLDAMSSPKADVLAAYALEAAKAKRWHDVGAALVRARAVGAEKALASALAPFDAEARKEAKRYEDLWTKGEPGDWVDDFFEWKDSFAHAPAAAGAMAAFETHRARHDPKAEEAVTEARTAFRSNDRDAGREKWQEVVTKWFASGRYPMVRRWLAESE
jgi:predicted esterase